jgi:hypothetical protein
VRAGTSSSGTNLYPEKIDSIVAFASTCDMSTAL